MDFQILINWMSPLSFLRSSGVIFTFLFHFSMKFMPVNRIAPDGAPRFAASHLGLFCLPMSHKKNARLLCVKWTLRCYWTEHFNGGGGGGGGGQGRSRCLSSVTWTSCITIGTIHPVWDVFIPNRMDVVRIVCACPYSSNIGLSAMTLYYPVQD